MRQPANRLLSMMPPSIAEELMETGGDFELANGRVIPSDQLSDGQVFIVTGGIASKFQLAPNGKISEIGMVGFEGLFPLAEVLGVPGAPHTVLAQIGTLVGRRIRTKDFHRILADSDESRQIVLRYAYAFMAQICSNLLCAELPVHARLARWLLMCHDRLPDDVIEVTHDTLALMTIAHRPTITNTLHAMRDEGLIDLGRGTTRIIDRDGLIAAADGAYGTSERYWQHHIGTFGKTDQTPPGPSPLTARWKRSAGQR